jgi:hypothetical protein
VLVTAVPEAFETPTVTFAFGKVVMHFFLSLGLIITLIFYAIGIGIYFTIKRVEENYLSEYERKIKKLREKKGMSEMIVAIADKDFNKFNERNINCNIFLTIFKFREFQILTIFTF